MRIRYRHRQLFGVTSVAEESEALLLADGEIEERSFVAKGAPLDDGQKRRRGGADVFVTANYLAPPVSRESQKFCYSRTEKSKRDPLSQKALLWMTAKNGAVETQTFSSPPII